jgi:hypothetical protein
MTTFVELLRTQLIAAAGVTTLVGSSPARIYANRAPQGTATPFCVISVISDVPAASFTGVPAELLRQARVQIDAYAKTYLEAHAVADAVDLVVAALSSPDLSAIRENGVDLYDDQAELHRVSADYFVSA